MARRATNTSFKKGLSGNPKGRPVGALSFSTKLKGALNNIAEGTGLPYDELIVKKLLKMAIVDGNMRAIELIFDRVDGKVTKTVAQENYRILTSDKEEVRDIVPNFITYFKAELRKKDDELDD